ncbi:uncharacterized protein K452DRAFT_309949 [Aplosporella prunicola CBS 121167]|uniref:Telomeric single stranded DNA binding POT1/Cdc13 domain-containing protein n=1 Tax=Aplosporella prunicola CBS 121167 TaxID=1176127 RepID=A0A6A6B7L0_9PEZI|nr:uncharacterized protein K452DRAFT_309949 [Aplosporella prunicola CBS 121167]KAF2140162.1 hypothetical protein K452DRAFT_309949 [Aplosporella prunicola CBS 121167]
MAAAQPERIPIATLHPKLPAPASKSITAIVTLLWPYSSSTRTCALLLAEPDFRLRRRRGQVRVQLFGEAAHAVATSGVGIGDEVVLRLTGAEWLRVQGEEDGVVTTPGKSVEWELGFRRRLGMRVTRDGQNLAHLDVSSGTPEPEGEQDEESAFEDSPLVARLSANGFQSAVWSSPAFLKRARLSLDQLDRSFGSGSDLFAEEDGYVEGKGRKRRRKSFKDINVWTYTTRTPSPEKTDAISVDDETAITPQEEISVAQQATPLSETPVSAETSFAEATAEDEESLVPEPSEAPKHPEPVDREEALERKLDEPKTMQEERQALEDAITQEYLVETHEHEATSGDISEDTDVAEPEDRLDASYSLKDVELVQGDDYHSVEQEEESIDNERTEGESVFSDAPKSSELLAGGSPSGVPLQGKDSAKEADSEREEDVEDAESNVETAEVSSREASEEPDLSQQGKPSTGDGRKDAGKAISVSKAKSPDTGAEVEAGPKISEQISATNQEASKLMDQPTIPMLPPALPYLQAQLAASSSSREPAIAVHAPETPQLQPVTSSTLPLPSPFPETTEATATSYMDSRPSIALEPSTADIQEAQHAGGKQSTVAQLEVPKTSQIDFRLAGVEGQQKASMKADQGVEPHSQSDFDDRFPFGLDGASAAPRPKLGPITKSVEVIDLQDSQLDMTQPAPPPVVEEKELVPTSKAEEQKVPADPSLARQAITPQPAPTPVVEMLAEKTSSDAELLDDTRSVATGNANQDQMDHFQSSIDEATQQQASQKLQQAVEETKTPPAEDLEKEGESKPSSDQIKEAERRKGVQEETQTPSSPLEPSAPVQTQEDVSEPESSQLLESSAPQGPMSYGQESYVPSWEDEDTMMTEPEAEPSELPGPAAVPQERDESRVPDVGARPSADVPVASKEQAPQIVDLGSETDSEDESMVDVSAVREESVAPVRDEEVTGRGRTIESVQTAEPVRKTERVQTAESVETAEPVQTIEPVQDSQIQPAAETRGSSSEYHVLSSSPLTATERRSAEEIEHLDLSQVEPDYISYTPSQTQTRAAPTSSGVAQRVLARRRRTKVKDSEDSYNSEQSISTIVESSSPAPETIPEEEFEPSALEPSQILGEPSQTTPPPQHASRRTPEPPSVSPVTPVRQKAPSPSRSPVGHTPEMDPQEVQNRRLESQLRDSYPELVEPLPVHPSTLPEHAVPMHSSMLRDESSLMRALRTTQPQPSAFEESVRAGGKEAQVETQGETQDSKAAETQVSTQAETRDETQDETQVTPKAKSQKAVADHEVDEMEIVHSSPPAQPSLATRHFQSVQQTQPITPEASQQTSQVQETSKPTAADSIAPPTPELTQKTGSFAKSDSQTTVVPVEQHKPSEVTTQDKTVAPRPAAPEAAKFPQAVAEQQTPAKKAVLHFDSPTLFGTPAKVTVPRPAAPEAAKASQAAVEQQTPAKKPASQFESPTLFGTMTPSKGLATHPSTTPKDAPPSLFSFSKPLTRPLQSQLATQSQSQGIRTALSYYTPLSQVPSFLNSQASTLDVLAVCTRAAKPPTRASAGPKDYFTLFRVADTSLTKGEEVRVQVFRPWKAALPEVEAGDAVLLRGFGVKSFKGGAGLVSGEAAAWCVWRYGKARERKMDFSQSLGPGSGVAAKGLDYDGIGGEAKETRRRKRHSTGGALGAGSSWGFGSASEKPIWADRTSGLWGDATGDAKGESGSSSSSSSSGDEDNGSGSGSEGDAGERGGLQVKTRRRQRVPREECHGPPVEVGEEERALVGGLRAWWLDSSKDGNSQHGDGEGVKGEE